MVHVHMVHVYLAIDNGTLSSRLTSSIHPSPWQPLTFCSNDIASDSSIPRLRNNSLEIIIKIIHNYITIELTIITLLI